MNSGSSGLLMDYYSLTMAQGYWKNNMNRRAVFEVFFRRQPWNGGFSIFAGLETLIETLKDFSFSKEDLDYLDSLHTFDDLFLDYLKNFRFQGSLWAMDEGTIIFPHEPIIRLDSNLIESQILEGLILNIINFQSLIATKSARVVLASNNGSVIEFGLRRAQGPNGALSASRAAFIGGVLGTSNVLAGKHYGIPVLGTMAHAWVLSFPSELEAFRSFASLYPDNAIFLIDTYDTLKSGIQNAIIAGRELAAKGKNFGVRLDSGDMHYLSVEVRRLLNEAGFPNANISVSNDLDEFIIDTLTKAGAPVDSWGVGTRMVTGGDEAAFNGVYKLTAKEDKTGKLIPAMKFSDNPEKTTTPGIKQVWRIKDEKGFALADIIGLDEEGNPDILEKDKSYIFWHHQADYRHFYHTITKEDQIEALLKKRLEGQKDLQEPVSLSKLQEKVREGLKIFDQSYKRILYPHIYKVSLTEGLRTLKLDLIKNHLGKR